MDERVARASFAFAVAGALLTWVVVGYEQFEALGLGFPVREGLVGLLAGWIATLGLRPTFGVFAASTIGLLAISLCAPVMLISQQGASGSESTFETMGSFAGFQAFAFAVLGVGLGLAVDRLVFTVAVPVTLCGVLAGAVMAIPCTSLRPRDESADGWIAAGLVAALALAGAWTGFVLAKRDGSPTRETM